MRVIQPTLASIGRQRSTIFACKQPAGGASEFACISSQPEGIEAWAQDLYRRFRGPIAVALELSKGPIVSALQKYDFMVPLSDQSIHVGQIP